MNHSIEPLSQDTLPSDEISLADIVNFISEIWKKLALASCLGALMGFGWWFQMGSYQTSLILNNQGAFDLLSWRAAQKSLPRLAQEIIDQKQVPAGLEKQYQSMKEETFWQRSFTPSFAISKVDTKDLASLGKDFDNAGSQIVSINLLTAAPLQDDALKSMQALEDFIRKGGAYLSLRTLFAGYETRLSFAKTDLEKKINSLTIELGYQQNRLKRLEELHRRFPTSSNVVSQVVDPKDSGAKYLPLTTQMIAANTDINASRESLQRYQDQLDQLQRFQEFVERAKPLLQEGFDGLAMLKKMKLITQELQTKLSAEDSSGLVEMQNVQTDLHSIQNRYEQSLVKYTIPVSIKKGMLKSTAAGLALGFFLMLGLMLMRKVLSSLPKVSV